MGFSTPRKHEALLFSGVIRENKIHDNKLELT